MVIILLILIVQFLSLRKISHFNLMGIQPIHNNTNNKMKYYNNYNYRNRNSYIDLFAGPYNRVKSKKMYNQIFIINISFQVVKKRVNLKNDINYSHLT